MTESKKPTAPRGLGRHGKALWGELHSALEYEPHETALVVEACRTLDRIEELQAVIDRDGVTTTGSMGQTVVHPAVPEQRQQQAGLMRLLTALNLDAALAGQGGAAGVLRAVSSNASKAANARWNKSKKARSA